MPVIYIGRSSLSINGNLEKGSCVLVSFLEPILALNCRLQVEQVNVIESAGDPFGFALRSLCFLSASQLLFS